ncbi:MAG: hypothetical protein HY350_00110, partial [Candidatus Omnitrophica bacterium]|nr:hypothetical protein [Candidatus Omnitrophota bacterium]
MKSISLREAIPAFGEALSALEVLFKKCKETEQVKEWKVREIPSDFKIEALDFGNLDGATVDSSYECDSTKTSHLFVKRIVVPAGIFGMKTAGCDVQFHIRMIRSAEVFLNGKSVSKDRFWLDADIPLTECLKDGDIFDIAIVAPKEEYFSGYGFNTTEIILDKVDFAFLKIEAFLYELILLEKILANTPASRRKSYEALIASSLRFIDIDEIKRGDVPAVIRSIDKAKGLLNKLSPEIKKYKVFLAGHAHIDMNWLWYWENTIETAERTFKSVDNLMSEFKDFKFSQSQAHLYLTAENNLPSLFNRIRQRIKEGRWDVTAAMWVEGDLNMASGEAIVRQILYSKKYLKEKFGVTPRVCWCPDTFGHPWTIPQILKKSGLDY